MHTRHRIDLHLSAIDLGAQLKTGPGKFALPKLAGKIIGPNNRRVLIACQGTNGKSTASGELQDPRGTYRTRPGVLKPTNNPPKIETYRRGDCDDLAPGKPSTAAISAKSDEEHGDVGDLRHPPASRDNSPARARWQLQGLQQGLEVGGRFAIDGYVFSRPWMSKL